DRLDADRDAVSRAERTHAVPDAALSALQRGVRRRVCGRHAVRPHAAPLSERPPRADAAPRRVRRLHEVEAGGMVRDRRADREVPERVSLAARAILTRAAGMSLLLVEHL